MAVVQNGTVDLPADQNARASHHDVDSAAESLGLASNMSELETLGYTIVPPEKLDAGDLPARLRERLAAAATKYNGGVPPDFETGSTHTDLASPTGQHLYYLLAEDPVFQEALLHPVVLALAHHLVGKRAILSSCNGMLKGPGRRPLPLHAESPIQTPSKPLECNVTWLLSDYTKENGALCFVPGSHLSMRQPTMAENFRSFAAAGSGVNPDWGVSPGVVDVAPNAVAVEAPAGSLAVWSGYTWHGAYNRVTPGIRMSVLYFFCSRWLRPQEPYRELISQDILDAHDDTFATLMGRDIKLGWQTEGPEERGRAFERARRRQNANSSRPDTAIHGNADRPAVGTRTPVWQGPDP